MVETEAPFFAEPEVRELLHFSEGQARGSIRVGSLEASDLASPPKGWCFFLKVPRPIRQEPPLTFMLDKMCWVESRGHRVQRRPA